MSESAKLGGNKKKNRRQGMGVAEGFSAEGCERRGIQGERSKCESREQKE